MKNKRFFPIMGMLVGVAMVAVGLVVQEMDHGIWVNPIRFGADFYTEIHEATAYAADSIVEVGQMLRSAFTAILCLFGLADICYFGCKLPRKEKTSANVPCVERNETVGNEESANTQE